MLRGLAALFLLLSAPLAAEIIASGEHGFTVRHAVTTDNEPFVVYRTLTSHVDQWWSGEHSWSGDASNLYMNVERGGCFCERLPNGGRVEHLRLIYFSPGSELRFDGSQVSFTYKVFGHPEGGLAAIAPAVDGVIGAQLGRLKERLEWD